MNRQALSTYNGQQARRTLPGSPPVPTSVSCQNTPYQHSGAGTAQPASEAKVLEVCHQILTELRHSIDEQKKIKEDVRRVGLAVNHVEESLKQVGESLKKHTEQSFSVETSGYKDALIKEVSALYCKSLKRLPSREEIGHCIVKVLQEDAKLKSKFNKAKVFCSNKLIDLRSEERRRILGNNPCGIFPSLTTEEFADKFLNTIKAPSECRNLYIKHLALLRKFMREVDAINDTFKKFREWVDDIYSLGCPTDEEWQTILQEDIEYQYNPVESSVITEFQDDQDFS